MSAAEFVLRRMARGAWRGVAPPQVRWVGVSQSLFVILDRGMLADDEKGELDGLVGCCGALCLQIARKIRGTYWQTPGARTSP